MIAARLGAANVPQGAPGWQLLLADLGLILFLITASALANAGERVDTSAYVSEMGEPVAVMRSDGGPQTLPELSAWLAEYQPDPREQLTLTLRHHPGDFADAQRLAAQLRGAALGAGHTPRIVVEEASATGVQASFAFDQSPQMARDLQNIAQ